jgi:glycosyltransferase involved in cell wall biosynthesis
MRIAILGTRGVPANYGGFETFAQELSVRLARRGHDVTVYCRRGNAPEPMHVYERVRLVTLPSLHTKFTDTLSHTFFSTLHLMLRGADVAYYCNAANAVFMWMPRLRGIATILNTDGLEWERAKWNWLGKTYYRMSEYLAAWIPHMLVSDSRVIQRYYREKFSADSAYVAYGADVVERGHGRGLLKQFGLEPEKYFLFVSRMEPENNAHVVVKAFEGVNTDMKLMMVGSAPFAAAYIRDLKSTRDPRILFPGGLYGDVYKALRANAYVYVNAMEVGGTHPAILEAMGAGNCVLVSDIAYNEETVAEAGVTFANKSVEDLRRQMQHLVDRPDEVAGFRTAAVERVRSTFSWEGVVDEYEQLFEELLAKARRG